jgi:hypothetical protein
MTNYPSEELLINDMAQPIYKVIFRQEGNIYEVYARQIFQSDMWGFIEIEEFLFGERSQILVDPSEERLKNEFGGVKRSYIPMHSVIRIDEVEKEGSAKISDAASGDTNISAFPMPGAIPTHRGGDE